MKSSRTLKIYGDDRRTEIVEREAAQAIDETQLVASEPVTVVLSQRGYASVPQRDTRSTQRR